MSHSQTRGRSESGGPLSAPQGPAARPEPAREAKHSEPARGESWGENGQSGEGSAAAPRGCAPPPCAPPSAGHQSPPLQPRSGMQVRGTAAPSVHTPSTQGRSPGPSVRARTAGRKQPRPAERQHAGHRTQGHTATAGGRPQLRACARLTYRQWQFLSRAFYSGLSTERNATLPPPHPAR